MRTHLGTLQDGHQNGIGYNDRKYRVRSRAVADGWTVEDCDGATRMIFLIVIPKIYKLQQINMRLGSVRSQRRGIFF